MKGPGRAWLRGTITVLAVAYPLALLVVVGLLRFVGERWWVTGVALYLPRAPFGAPLLLLVPALLVLRKRRLLWAQAASVLLLAFPLMGFVPPWPKSTPPAPVLRVLSYNVNSGAGGLEQIAKAIASAAPDIVIVQELSSGAEPLAALLRPVYANVQISTQFLIATRFPIVSTTEPPEIPFAGKQRSPRFLQYVLDTPLGLITLYSVHPISPREVLYALRGHGLSGEISSGRIFSGENGPAIRANCALRALQVEAVQAMAERQSNPVVIVGDLNLPTLSPVLQRYFGGYRDAFRASSWGFGYTYPAKFPWLRLDRVLATDALAFTAFEVGCGRLSDHGCIIADLRREP